MKVLLAASECAPLVKVGGIADVIGSLPIALKDLGIDARVVIPFYKNLIEKVNQSDSNFLHLEKLTEFTIRYGQKDLKSEIFLTRLANSNIEYYLIYNDDYISNGGIYFSPETMPSPDAELERFAVFSKIVAQYFTYPNPIFQPDIIHCNDWHTGMVPQIIQNISRYTKLQNQPKTLFTIHNLAYQGFSKLDVAYKLGLDLKLDKTLKWDAQDNNVDFVLQGIIGSDYITTVSKKYSEEIQTQEFGEGLNEILDARKGRLMGILNGISYEIFNPLTDKTLKFNYSVSNFKEGKLKNKAELQNLAGLEIQNDRPLVGIISRLAHQKGLDLVSDVIDEILQLGYQVIILGTGDPQLEAKFAETNKRPEYKKNYKAFITFSEDIARKIYAGSDMFLIPSRFEPCGLTQLIAMKYGSVPVARGVGGLYDTIQDNQTGFLYYDFSTGKMLEALKRALVTFTSQKASWNKLIETGMKKDFSWTTSAQQYAILYKKILNL